MSFLKNRLTIGALAGAVLIAGAVTAFGSQQQQPAPTIATATTGLFDKAAVGGRTGCEVQSWPYIAPECLEGEHAKSVRRL